jgi:hypothetical protein
MKPAIELREWTRVRFSKPTAEVRSFLHAALYGPPRFAYLF